MELIKSTSELLTKLDDLRKILLYKRDELSTFQISQVSLQILLFVRENPAPLSEFFLEFLIRLSYALYIKSQILLNLPFKEEEEEISEIHAPEKRRIFSLYQVLPLKRVLGEEVFLPRVNGYTEIQTLEERGNLSLLLTALLKVLEKVKAEPELYFEFERRSLDEYLEDLRTYLFNQRLISWDEFIQKKGVQKKIDLIYYFLALLFLVFYGEAGLYQRETEDIQIFLKK